MFEKLDSRLNPSHKFFPFRRLILRIFLGIFAFFLLFFIYLWWDMPSLANLENPKIPVSSQIYSRDGKLLGNFYDDAHRVQVRYKELPPALIQALISTEDVRFYQHNGVDLFSLAGSIYETFTSRTRGGSTITQQLARNLYAKIGREKSVFRKIKEALTAWLIESKFSKEEILIFYFNTVNYGSNIHGIQTASKYYFNKNCSELNEQECALLIGILKGPSYYNPFSKPDRAIERRNIVLGQMVKYKFLDTQKANELKRLPLGVKTDFKQQVILPHGLASYFKESVKSWLKEWCEKNDLNLYTDGLKIYTTLDSRMQSYAEASFNKNIPQMQQLLNQDLKTSAHWNSSDDVLIAAMKRSSRFAINRNAGMSESENRKTFDKPVLMKVFSWNPDKNYETDTLLTPWDSLRYYAGILHGGLVTLDPSNGHILAWVGGINQSYFNFDFVKQEKRSAGTAFMPFVYAAGFENGYKPCDIIPNSPISIKTPEGDLWTPKNTGAYIGNPVSLKQALIRMYNIPAVRVTDKISSEKVVETCSKLGITSPLKPIPSIALGTADVSIFEMTSAYAAFANQGTWLDPIFVTRIEDKNGNVLVDFEAKKRSAISPQSAYAALDMLKSNVNAGLAYAARSNYKLGKVELAGMTGRTQTHADSWYFGMTPHYVTGIWMGCTDRRIRFRSFYHGQGAFLCLPVWGDYMENVYNDPSYTYDHYTFRKPQDFKWATNCVGEEDKRE